VRARSRAFLTAAVVFAVLALDLVGRERIALFPDWAADLDPLLGATPKTSFAHELDAEPFLDFRLKPFDRKRPGRRALLLGGARAFAKLPQVEHALEGAEVVLAAREDFGTVQEAAILARFAPGIAPSLVIALDGEELAGSPRRAGWTQEWDWARASIESPLGELVARVSGVARLLFVRPEEVLEPADARARYVSGVRSVRALAAARDLPLYWALVPDAGLDPAARASLRRELDAQAGPCEAFDSEAELLARLARR
jgi:hypothetical protein